MSIPTCILYKSRCIKETAIFSAHSITSMHTAIKKKKSSKAKHNNKIKYQMLIIIIASQVYFSLISYLNLLFTSYVMKVVIDSHSDYNSLTNVYMCV